MIGSKLFHSIRTNEVEISIVLLIWYDALLHSCSIEFEIALK